METGKRTERFVFPIPSPSSTFAHLSQPLIRSQNRYPSTLPNRLSNTSNPLSLKLAQTKKSPSALKIARIYLSNLSLITTSPNPSQTNKKKQRLLQNRKLTLGPLMKMTAQVTIEPFFRLFKCWFVLPLGLGFLFFEISSPLPLLLISPF
jgi:hypothetical protein